MSSKKIVAIAGSVIAAGCYFIVLFLIGGLTGVSLISSVFTLAALGLCIGGAYVYLEEPVVEQYFYIFPGAYIGMLYLAVQMVVSLVIAGLHPAIVAQLIVEFVILGIFGSLQCYALYAGLRARELKRRRRRRSAPCVRSLPKRQRFAKTPVIINGRNRYRRSRCHPLCRSGEPWRYAAGRSSRLMKR